MLDDLLSGYFLGILFVVFAVCFVLDFFLDGLFNILTIVGTFCLYGFILFLILYIPLTIANKINMKKVRERMNATWEEAGEQLGAEIEKVNTESIKEEQRTNPDWKKNLRKDIDKEMRSNGVTGVMHR